MDKEKVTVGSSKSAVASDKSRKLKTYGTLAVALIFGAIGAYLLLSSKAATPEHSSPDLSSLVSGQTLSTGQAIASSTSNPAFRLVMQGDGNLVVYNSAGQATWNSHTAGTGSNNRLVLQTDGNLVVYTASNKPVWNTETNRGTDARDNEKLLMQVDGNLVLYNQSTEPMQPLWSTLTGRINYYSTQLGAGQTLRSGHSLGSSATNPAYKAVMQVDGNFVVYKGTTPIWQSGTSGTGSDNWVVLQTDGNLVMYKSQSEGTVTAIWNTGTNLAGHDFGSGKLIMQGDGNLVLYNQNMTPRWSSYTGKL